MKEYWIVHPVDRIFWKYLLEKNVYGKSEIFDSNAKPQFRSFPDFQIDLYRVFDVKESDFISEPTPEGYIRL